jgi:hypothetical protein
MLYRFGEEAALSPDGRSIAFVNGEVGKVGHELWVGGIDGRPPRKLAASDQFLGLRYPAWSPDGRWLAYWRNQGLNPSSVTIEATQSPQRTAGAAEDQRRKGRIAALQPGGAVLRNDNSDLWWRIAEFAAPANCGKNRWHIKVTSKTACMNHGVMPNSVLHSPVSAVPPLPQPCLQFGITPSI